MADLYMRILLSVQSGVALSAIKSVVSALKGNLVGSLQDVQKAQTGLKSTTSNLHDVAKQAQVAGLDVSKFSTAEAKAGEAAAKLGVAQANAASAIQRASSLASSGAASAEQLAIAQAKAALAAEKVKVAEVAASNAVQKTAQEINKLSVAMNDSAAKSSVAARLADSTRNAFASMGSVAKGVAVAGVVALGAALAAVGAAMVSSVQKAADFEATLNQIYATNQITKQEINALGDTLLQLGPKVGKGPQDLAEGLYYVMGAGYQSAQAMDILERSAKAVAGTTTGTTVVANALTATLKAFPGLSVAQAMDMMTASVATGKTEWKDYGPAIGRVALFAQHAGVSFAEATAALSTLTNVMPSTAEASTSLNSLLQTSSRFSELADRAGKLGLAFDTNAYKSMDLIGRLKYLQQVTGGNTEAIAKLLGQEEALPAITALLTNGARDYASALDSVTNSAGKADETFQKTSAGTQAAWARAGAALESLQIKIGTALLPAINLFSDSIAPAIARVIDWIEKNHILENAISTLSTTFKTLVSIGTQVVSFFQNNQVAMAGLIGVGVALAAVFVAIAISATAAAIAEAAALWPIIAIAAAIAVLVAAFILLYNNSAPFRELLSNIGTMFMSIWNMLVANLTPAFQQLSAAFQQLLPVLQVVGIIIGGVVLVAIGLLVASIASVATAIAMAAAGISTVVTGIVNMFSGAFNIIAGIVMFFVHLFTGQFDKLGSDLARIGAGIVQLFTGMWQIVSGVFQTALGFIIGLVSGWIQSVITWFTGLYNMLVGNSIIPDMINGIINWFLQLPSRAGEAIASMASTVLDKINNLASEALNAGANIVNNIAQGIRNGIRAVAGAITDLTSYVSQFLPKSPAKMGPLKDLHYQGEQISNQVSKGMIAGVSDVESAAIQMSAPIISNLKGSDFDYIQSIAKAPSYSTSYEPPTGYTPHSTTNNGTTIIYSPVYNISTMARSRSEVERLVNMIDEEQGRRFRMQTAGYGSGGVL